MLRMYEQRHASGRLMLLALFVSCAPAFGQKYEITPLFGATFGGTMHLEQTGTPNFYAHIADSFSFGLTGGYRFEGDGDDHSAIEFRWMRQSSHLFVQHDPLAPIPYMTASFRPSITIDEFLADFTHEFATVESPRVEPFVTGSLGAALLSAPASSATRFVWGVGGGVKVFPSTHWGVRLLMEYRPVVMHTELQKLVCAGGCVVVLNGGIMNQFVVSLGPSFRF